MARTTPVEHLLEIPGAAAYLIEKGLPCLVCGEAAWGTLEHLAASRGLSPAQIDRLVAGMNQRLSFGRRG